MKFITVLFSSIFLLFQLTICECSDCETTQFPPNASVVLPRYTIDLDAPPKERWAKLARDKGSKINEIFVHVKALMEAIIGTRVFNIINQELDWVAKSLPSPYYEEIQGMSIASGLPVSYLTLYNIFYESFVFCTSIIVQDKQGDMFIGRNLDNGAMLGWDNKNQTWVISEILKPLSVHLQWIKNGKLLFESVSFAGYLGVLTAVKKDAFSFSLNKRMALNNGMVGLLEWIALGDHHQHWVTFLSREVLEHSKSFDEAKKMLGYNRLIAPVYYMLAGVKPGQGVIMTRGRNMGDVDFLEMGSPKANNDDWFLVQTNYDHWSSPPFFDNRRRPAKRCMMDGGQHASTNDTLKVLANVLSTKPVLNKSTVYTALMNAKNGTIIAWTRDCKSILCPLLFTQNNG